MKLPFWPFSTFVVQPEPSGGLAVPVGLACLPSQAFTLACPSFSLSFHPGGSNWGKIPIFVILTHEAYFPPFVSLSLLLSLLLLCPCSLSACCGLPLPFCAESGKFGSNGLGGGAPKNIFFRYAHYKCPHLPCPSHPASLSFPLQVTPSGISRNSMNSLIKKVLPSLPLLASLCVRGFPPPVPREM